MTFTEKFKTQLMADYDLDLVGIAAASVLSGEPEGHRPEDLLPGAKSIIVFGRSLTDGAFQGMFRTLEENKYAAETAYSSYCDDLAPNFLLISDAFKLCCYLEDTYGTPSLPCPFNVLQSMHWNNTPGKFFADPYGQGMPLDISKAAMAAGLGEYGWSNRFLTPEYGPRQMLTAVVTTLELTPDAPYSGPKLCDPEACGICAKLCPTGAIASPCSGCGKTVSVEGKEQTVAQVNANACTIASLGLRKEFHGRVPVPDLIMHNDPTDEEMAEAFKKKPLNEVFVEHYPRSFCERCMVYCPVGNWKEHFSDTGLSSFDPESVK